MLKYSQYQELIPNEISKAIYTRKLTFDHLRSLPLYDMLRIASDNDYVRAVMKTNTEFTHGVPLDEKYTLKDHQIKSFMWMRGREKNPKNGIRGGILSLDMGLGKTLCAAYYSLAFRGDTPTLVVASKTVMGEWKQQMELFFGDYVKVCYFHSDHIDVNKWTPDKFNEYDIVVTTYDVVTRACAAGGHDSSILETGERLMSGKVVCVHERGPIKPKHITGVESIFEYQWHRVIADESQRFANYSSRIYRAMMAISKKFGWCLSGTPIRNYDTDMWTQLRWLGYKSISREMDWKGRGVAIFKKENLGIVVMSMSYADAGITLPEKSEERIDVVLTKREQLKYDRLIEKTREAYIQHIRSSTKDSYARVLASFGMARQACISVDLITSPKDRSEKDTTEGSSVHKSSKIRRCVELIQSLDRKTIVFSSYVTGLTILRYALEEEGIKYSMVTGCDSTANRATKLASFREKQDTRVLLMTYKVGAEGLNLTQATAVICLEPWWSPAVRDQAHARTWRIGQSCKVTTYDLIAKNTIEDRILAVCEQKREMMKAFKGEIVKTKSITSRELNRILFS
jgi:SNF2 family DNA or RNA helicase